MSSGAAEKALQQHAFETGNNLALLPSDLPVSASDAPVASDPSSLLLPFAEREYIDTARAANILGIAPSTVYSFYAAGLIDMIGYAPRKRKRVRYQSIVDLCNELRRRHCIHDRRPPLPNSLFRHRDADLLPFPIEDSIGIPEAIEILGYTSANPVRTMIEEGRFEAYQFSPVSPWRISKTSLAAYIERVRSRESATPISKRRLSFSLRDDMPTGLLKRRAPWL